MDAHTEARYINSILKKIIPQYNIVVVREFYEKNGNYYDYHIQYKQNYPNYQSPVRFVKVYHKTSAFIAELEAKKYFVGLIYNSKFHGHISHSV